MAAINAAGFDVDADVLEEGSARSMVRKSLANLDPVLRDRLRSFYQEINTEQDHLAQQSKYVSYALLLRGPPDFTLEVKEEDLPSDVKPLIGFELLLREFWEKAELGQLWRQLESTHADEAMSYKPLIRNMIIETLGFLRTTARVALDRRVVFIPDLLNAFGVVNARNLSNTYFVIVGPTRAGTESIEEVRHEYLHFLIEPLVNKYRGYLPEPAPYFERAEIQPHVVEAFVQSFPLMVAESLIRAVEIRLGRRGEDQELSRVIEEYERGLILAPYFRAGLAEWEAGEESLEELVPELIKGIRWDIEKEREEEISRMRMDLALRRERAAEQKKSERAHIQTISDLLKRANELLLQKQFEDAERLLEEVLLLDNSNASALFGMAQIAGQRQALGQALELYERAALNASDRIWIAAWSHLRRGNILQLQGHLEKAVAEWSKVLRLQGDLHGADEEAKKALARIRR
jgi:hypothetical protein